MLLDLNKPIIGMVHLQPLPGAPRYDTDAGIQGLVDWASRDLAALQQGGVDAVMFGNEADLPYVLAAPPEGIAAMSAVITALKPQIEVPFGVNYLWDPVPTISIAAATGPHFAREIMTGVYASDMGMWEPDCAGAMRLRAQVGRDDLTMLFNINAEFAAPLDTRPIDVRAKSAVFSSLADVICVSGPMTGQGVDQSDLRRVKEAIPETPVFANTGVNRDTVADILTIADGAVVGTHFKQDGNTWNPVDGERVARFMEQVGELR